MDNSFASIRADIKRKIYKPVYLLTGDEDYFIDQLVELIEHNILSEEEKAFNMNIFYGLESKGLDVVSAAKRYPMMANHNVVLVKEAQHLGGKDDLISYLENPTPSTILAIVHKQKKIDKRKNYYKAFKKHAEIFESKKLYENQVPSWIVDEVKNKGLLIEPRESQLLADYLGNNLSTISNELEKISINLKQGEQITSSVIENNVGISKEFNAFELTDALSRRDVLKSNRIAAYFAMNEKLHPIQLTIGTVYRFFTNLLHFHYLKDKSSRNVASNLGISPYFVKDLESASRHYKIKDCVSIISILKSYDLMSKGVNNPSVKGGELTKEMVFQILHCS